MLAVGVLFGFLVFLILLQTLFSPAFVLAGVIGGILLVVTLMRPHWTLGLLAVYLPFESIFLKFTPDEVYLMARYGSELLIYLVAAVVVVRLLSGKLRFKSTPFDLPMLLFVLAMIGSAVLNLVHPTIALLGARQILRFMIVLFLTVQLVPSKTFVRKLTIVMFGVVLFQSLLGLLQSVTGGTLDAFLLPSEERTYGTLTLTAGVNQFWDPGSRVFATLGRYDRLGNFLYFFLLIGSGILFTKQALKKYPWLVWVFLAAIPTLALTFSRASWFAFLLGFLFIGLIIRKNKYVLAGVVSIVLILSTYLVGSGLNVSLITDSPGQTWSERFYESFSLARWRGEYYGLGRTFWLVHTPKDVVSSAPILGVGPGQFGGGAAAALHNTTVYEDLGLPYGVFGTEGFIDNNWFSLWGEVGTLGMIFYGWLYLALFAYAVRTARQSSDPYVQALALGYAACLIGVGFNAFTSTVLEIRTLSYYVWLYGGFVFVLGEHHRSRGGNRSRS